MSTIAQIEPTIHVTMIATGGITTNGTIGKQKPGVRIGESGGDRRSHGNERTRDRDKNIGDGVTATKITDQQ